MYECKSGFMMILQLGNTAGETHSAERVQLMFKLRKAPSFAPSTVKWWSENSRLATPAIVYIILNALCFQEIIVIIIFDCIFIVI